MAWWNSNRIRLIQNNLRETDAGMDVDACIRELKSFEANAWMINAGGIFAFYPSKLEFHYVTPYLKKDLLGEAVEKAHRNGLRVIARFDFSKAHHSIFAKRPEWFYRTADGRTAEDSGLVHTCLNGGYQQEYSLSILDEVISNYDVDGVFFNMFGYRTTDYRGRDYGICHCGNCRRRFRELHGRELPSSGDGNDPALEAYRSFREETTRELLDRIRRFVKGKNPDIAISTYHHHGVDIIRKESNTAIGRPLPTWPYSASENVMSVENSWEDKLVSNCSINAIDLPYRFTGVSEHENEIRLYESIAAGSGLDFCIIGSFEGYPDETNLESTRRAFRFHKEHESIFGGLRTVADVALLKPEHGDRAAMQEYHGIFKMLKESHIPFRAVETAATPDLSAALEGVKAAILPGLRRFKEQWARALEARLHAGMHLLATGRALADDPERLRKLFGARIESVLENTEAAYVQIDDKALFTGFPKRNWVFVHGPFACVSYDSGAAVDLRLPLVSPAPFGPPECAYGHRVERRWFGFGTLKPGTERAGAGEAAYIPWSPGALYYRNGYEDHLHIVIDPLRRLIGEEPALQMSAPSCIEAFLSRLPNGSMLLQLINHSGFNGLTYRAPLPIRGITAAMRGVDSSWTIRVLSGGRAEWLPEGGTMPVRLRTDVDGVHAAILLEKGGDRP